MACAIIDRTNQYKTRSFARRLVFLLLGIAVGLELLKLLFYRGGEKVRVGGEDLRQELPEGDSICSGAIG